MTRTTYSTYEAKARFSEVLRKVRGGESVFITYRGEEVAEIRPVVHDETLRERLEKLEKKGIISRAGRDPADIERALRPLGKRPGGLKRFLESRD